MFMVPDTAWKFGCGRYIQKSEAIRELNTEILRLGKKPLLLSGIRAWESVGDAVLAGIGTIPYKHCFHRGPCSEEIAHAYAIKAYDADCDVVIGVGGGVLMDTAKLTAEFAKLPIVTVPTISATCAAFAPISVVYTPSGKTRGTWFYKNEVNCVVVDMDVLSRQSLRYAASGIVDSLAKAIEIRHNLRYEASTPELALAQINADYIFSRLTKLSQRISEKTLSPELQEMVYLTIPATGLVSGMARGQMQSALGHCLYESVRTVFTKEAACVLHGELVGIGLRFLLKYDGENAELLDETMKKLYLPMRLSETGIPFTNSNLELLCETILASPLARTRNYDKNRISDALKYIW